MTEQYDLITVLGPTASGKTSLAIQLALMLDGEILSADSRQVYRGMDIGTGKDLNEYKVGDRVVPCHLTDIVDAGDAFDLYQYLKAFYPAFQSIQTRKRQPLMCGGSGMYLEAILKGYPLIKVDEDPELRRRLGEMSDEMLIDKLKSYKPLHNTTDIHDRSRLLRAVEIAIKSEKKEFAPPSSISPIPLRHFVVGIMMPRALIRERITARLHRRLNEGMVEEVQSLLNSGVDAQILRYYGLEYRFITNFLTGMITQEAMISGLNTAIHQFAKRQMTWFRRMEKNGLTIHWIDGIKNAYNMANLTLEMIKT